MITFAAVGDVGPESADVDALFAGVAPAIRSADLAFCQLEMNLTERGQRVPQVRHTSRTHPDAAHAIRRAGFGVVSWASNHALDWGYEGFFDTVHALEAAGITVVGVGADLAQARRIRVVDIRGVRVAVLAYCSILPADYWATERRAGVAPLRALTHCEPIEPDQPGTPVRIRTFAHPDDLRGLLDDVAQARAAALPAQVKFRTGATPTWPWPTERELAEFITGAVSRGLPFKLTGGLHHLLRADHDGGRPEHGLLNVLLATQRAVTEPNRVDEVESVLAERDPLAVVPVLERWKPAQIEAVRSAFTAYGCCGVTDPLTELDAMGLLPADLATDLPHPDER